MKSFAALAALSVSALALSAPAARADYTLTLLHINDWHSRIESNNKFESTCSAEEEAKNECVGGAARLVTAVNAERAKLAGQNVLLLDAGDNFQGSLFYSTFKGVAEEEFLNQLKFDAMTVGNHEFDDGEDALAPFLDAATFPVLGANVVAGPNAKVGSRIKPSVVLDVGGQKIGVVGVVTTDTPELASPGPNITIIDDVAALTAEAKALEAQGVNKIVALTHVGYNRDRDVIAKIPGVDVVVGGHSHTLLSNTDPKAEGPYPTMVDGAGGAKVPVVTAASYSKLLGELRVVFDDNGNVLSASGDPIALDSSVTPDPAALARIKEMGAPIEALKEKIVGAASGPIDSSRETCRARECAMGDLVADAILDRTKGQGVQIVFQNGGGLRASIDGGPVSMGEVLTVLPFQNTVATFGLSGADVLTSLESGVSEIADGKGKFPQVAGLKYTLDATAAPNSRVSNVTVLENGAYVPLDPAKTYLVATNNYVRQGGDGYKLFASNAQNAYDYGPSLEQVVADYLTANNPYTPKTDGRIMDAAPAQTAQADTPAAAPTPAPSTPEATTTAPASDTAASAQPAPTTPASQAATTPDATAPAQTTPSASGDTAAQATAPAAPTPEPTPPAATTPDATAPASSAASGETPAPAAPSADSAATAPASEATVQGEAPVAPTPETTQPSAATPDVTAPATASGATVQGETPATPTPETTQPAAATPDVTAPGTDASSADAAAPASGATVQGEAPVAPTPETTQPAASTPDVTAPSAASAGASAPEAPSDAASGAPASAPTAPSSEPVPAPVEQATVRERVVREGDSFWRIAEEAYGDGFQWRRIAEANKRYKPRALPVGVTLVIPER